MQLACLLPYLRQIQRTIVQLLFQQGHFGATGRQLILQGLFAGQIVVQLLIQGGIFAVYMLQLGAHAGELFPAIITLVGQFGNLEFVGGQLCLQL